MPREILERRDRLAILRSALVFARQVSLSPPSPRVVPGHRHREHLHLVGVAVLACGLRGHRVRRSDFIAVSSTRRSPCSSTTSPKMGAGIHSSFFEPAGVFRRRRSDRYGTPLAAFVPTSRGPCDARARQIHRESRRRAASVVGFNLGGNGSGRAYFSTSFGPISCRWSTG